MKGHGFLIVFMGLCVDVIVTDGLRVHHGELLTPWALPPGDLGRSQRPTRQGGGRGGES